MGIRADVKNACLLESPDGHLGRDLCRMFPCQLLDVLVAGYADVPQTS